MSANTTSARRGTRRGRRAGRRTTPPGNAARAAPTNSAPDCQRSPGSFSSAREITSSSAGGRPGRRSLARRLVLQVRVDRRCLRVARERHLAGQALEQHAPQRVEIRAAIGLLGADALGGDVVDRSDELVGGREPTIGRGVFGQPEVGEVHVLRGALDRDQCVARLHVAVHQPARMGRVQRIGELRHQANSTVRRQRPSHEAARRGPCPRRSASRYTGGRRPPPPRRSARCPRDRSTRQAATRPGTARGTADPASRAALAASAPPGAPGASPSRDTRRPCHHDRAAPRCGNSRLRSHSGNRHRHSQLSSWGAPSLTPTRCGRHGMP